MHRLLELNDTLRTLKTGQQLFYNNTKFFMQNDIIYKQITKNIHRPIDINELKQIPFTYYLAITK